MDLACRRSCGVWAVAVGTRGLFSEQQPARLRVSRGLPAQSQSSISPDEPRREVPAQMHRSVQYVGHQRVPGQSLSATRDYRQSRQVCAVFQFCGLSSVVLIHRCVASRVSEVVFDDAFDQDGQKKANSRVGEVLCRVLKLCPYLGFSVVALMGISGDQMVFGRSELGVHLVICFVSAGVGRWWP